MALFVAPGLAPSSSGPSIPFWIVIIAWPVCLVWVSIGNSKFSGMAGNWPSIFGKLVVCMFKGKELVALPNFFLWLFLLHWILKLRLLSLLLLLHLYRAFLRLFASRTLQAGSLRFSARKHVLGASFFIFPFFALLLGSAESLVGAVAGCLVSFLSLLAATLLSDSGVGADTGASTSEEADHASRRGAKSCRLALTSKVSFCSKVLAGTLRFLTHLSDILYASLTRFRSALRHCAATTVYASPVLTLLWWQDWWRTPLWCLFWGIFVSVFCFVHVMSLDSRLLLFHVPLTRIAVAGLAGASALCLRSIVTFILSPQAWWGFLVCFPVLASMVSPCPPRPLGR